MTPAQIKTGGTYLIVIGAVVGRPYTRLRTVREIRDGRVFWVVERGPGRGTRNECSLDYFARWARERVE